MKSSDFLKKLYNRLFDFSHLSRGHEFKFSLAICFASLLLIVTLFTACGNVKKSEKNLLALDTVITLTAEGENAEKANEEASDFIKHLDKLISYQEGSELTLLNSDEGVNYIEVAPEVQELLSLGKDYTHRAKGAYNVSAGALVELWDKAREIDKLPTDAEISLAKSTASVDNFMLSYNKVKKSMKSAKATFGAIAKGYAADKVCSLYKANNVSGFLNFGTSTIVAIGDQTYRVGIKNPRDENALIGKVALKNAALSTSGDYERYFIKDNIRYHHIIDPKTGYPAKSGIASATVIVPLTHDNAAALSDALSTALMVLGANGEPILEQDIKALLVTTEGKTISLNSFEIEN